MILSGIFGRIGLIINEDICIFTVREHIIRFRVAKFSCIDLKLCLYTPAYIVRGVRNKALASHP